MHDEVLPAEVTHDVDEEDDPDEEGEEGIPKVSEQKPDRSGSQTIQSCRLNLRWSAIDALMCPIVAGVEIV